MRDTPRLVLKVNDAGIIETGNWCSITPVRGVEKLAVGKTPEQVPKIASRVCGICPIAHCLAATEAMEASIKCEIPKDALMLRHILQLANRCHSIALHNILLLPDYYIPGTETKINPFTAEEPVRTVAKRIQRLREISQTIGQICRWRLHPPEEHPYRWYVPQLSPSRPRPRCTTLPRKDLSLPTHSQSS